MAGSRRLILKRLRQSELGFFEACRRAGRETGRQRALNIDSDVVREVFGEPSSDVIEVTSVWHNGQQRVEDHRPIRLQQKNWRLAGVVVEGERFSSVRPDDIVLLDVEQDGESTRSMVTWDVVSQSNESTWSLFELASRALGPASSVVATDAERDSLLRVAQRRLLAFGGTDRFDTAGLSDEDWDRCIEWLSKLPREVIERLGATGASTEAQSVLVALGTTFRTLGLQEQCEALLRRCGDELLADSRRRALIAEAYPAVELPTRWERGSGVAKAFVEQLGLPPSMAGTTSIRPPDEEEVGASQPLAPLHDYQNQVARQIREVLKGGTWDRRRAVVWLPTGTGKTRVTVETLLLECLLQPPRNCILWVADREELCEQAVETFRHFWLLRGRESRTCAAGTAPTLQLIRFWGGRDWREPHGSPTVIVASIQSMARRLESEAFREELALLSERCAAIVFDEAHHVVAPSYTRVMEALGLTRTRNYLGRNRDSAPPLLGLTATPARTREDETEGLSQRFAGRLIEPDEEWRSLARFQRDGYLSRMKVHLVKTGYRVTLTESERHQLSLFQTLPESTLARVGQDPQRTARIVEDLEGRLGELRSVLAFACSVEHAHVLADVLSRRGFNAAALDGSIPRAVRWKTIQRFRAGTLQVLVNCDLLATGFDAPNIDAVIIARPVESSVLFAQMLGRGLRGPRNGGTASCVLVDYEDSFEGLADLEGLRRSFRQAFLESGSTG